VNIVDETPLKSGDNYIDITAPSARFPIKGNSITTLFSVGHIKLTALNDEEFAERVCYLEKSKII